MGDVTAPSSDDEVRVATRYPKSRLHGWPVMLLAIVLGTAMIGWLIWAGMDRSRPDVAAQVHSFSVVDDNQIEVTLMVDRRDPERHALCTIVAQSEDFERVGELLVTIPTGQSRTIKSSYTVRTIKRATTAIVQNCQVP